MSSKEMINIEIDATKVLKEALATYKKDEKEYFNVVDAWHILIQIFPKVSTDHETLGLACSITRRLYEMKRYYIYRVKAEFYAKRFFDLFKTNYSFSSMAMYLIAATENNYYSFSVYKRRARRLLKAFEDQSDKNFEPEYRVHTLNLLKAMQGIQCTDYLGDYTSTSSLAYTRAIELHKKINKCNREYLKVW